MTEPEKSSSLSHIVIIAAAIVFIIWGISQAETFLVLFLVSVFLAVLATPPVFWLKRKGMPVVPAVLLIVAGMICFLLAVGVLVGSSINGLYAALPQYQARIEEQGLAFRNFLLIKDIVLPENLLREYFNLEATIGLTIGLVAQLGSAFSNMVLIMLTVTFILFEATSFPVKIRTVLGDPLLVFPQFIRFVDDMKRYMVIKTIICLATGVLVTIWLSILQVDFPFLWGFAAFMLNYVPNLGSLIAAIPAILLSFIQLGIWRALLVAMGYVVINLVLGYAVETRLMGRKLGLSTLVVFLSLIFWGSLLGPGRRAAVHSAHHDPQIRIRAQCANTMGSGLAGAGAPDRKKAADICQDRIDSDNRKRN
jgi:AI-2 transport protein TqsA